MSISYPGILSSLRLSCLARLGVQSMHRGMYEPVRCPVLSQCIRECSEKRLYPDTIPRRQNSSWPSILRAVVRALGSTETVGARPSAKGAKNATFPIPISIPVSDFEDAQKKEREGDNEATSADVETVACSNTTSLNTLSKFTSTRRRVLDLTLNSPSEISLVQCGYLAELLLTRKE